ncbi:MAG: RidA family protein [Deltaproteobacteria bacterium]|nr:RidA family protein [Deltaproteobacteria bacterium]
MSTQGTLQRIQPEGWAQPKGYANGMVGRGRVLFVAGQVGWDAQERFHTAVLHEQWAQALDNVLAVVRAAGGLPEHVARMTVFVTDHREYSAQRAEIGQAWRDRMGRHYPAMSLVEVRALLEQGAKVEIEATAVLPD